jgi:hypothetical protein
LLPFVQEENQIELLRKELGEFSHRCRNMLNGMKMSFYFVRRSRPEVLPPWWNEVEERYREIERLFDTLQRIYRPMPLTVVRACFGSLVRDRLRTWRMWFQDGGRELELVPPAEERPGEFDPICLGMALDAFVEWRAHTMSPVGLARLGWRMEGDQILVDWVETPQRELPGASCPLAEASCTPPTTPRTDELALPLLARVLTAHRGSLRRSPGPEVNYEFRLPLRHSATTSASASPTPLPMGGRP